MSRAVPSRLVAPVCSGLVAFGLYLSTLVKGPVHWDAPLWAFCAKHACSWLTGYPLYSLVSYPFAQLPVGTTIYRVALFSALLGGVAVAVLCRIMLMLVASPSIAFLSSLTFAVAPWTWEYSCIPEVYTLFWIIVGVLVILVIRVLDGDDRASGWLILAYALSFTHHLLTVSLLPAVSFALLASQGRRVFSRRNIAFGLMGIAVIAAMYIYGYFRNRTGVMGEEIVAGAGEYIDRILGDKDREVMFILDASALESSATSFAENLFDSFPFPLWVLAICGLAAMVKKRRKLGLFFVFAICGILFFALNIHFNEQAIYFAPVHFILAIPLAFILDGVHDTMRTRATKLVLLLVFIPSVVGAVNTYARLKDKQAESIRWYESTSQMIRQLDEGSLVIIPNQRLANAFVAVAEDFPEKRLDIFGISPHKRHGAKPGRRIDRALRECRSIYIFGPPDMLAAYDPKLVSLKIVVEGRERDVDVWRVKGCGGRGSDG